jgi:hypothetical protein
MSHTDLAQPDLAAPSAGAKTGDSRMRRPGFLSAFGYRLGGADPLACDLCGSLTEAGLTLHHSVKYDLRHRLGGACLLPGERCVRQQAWKPFGPRIEPVQPGVSPLHPLSEAA